MQILVILDSSPESITILMDILERYLKNGARLITNTSIIIKGGVDALRRYVKRNGNYRRREKRAKKKWRKTIQMGKDYEPMDLSDLDEIRERFLTDPSYNDIEIVSTSLEEFLEDIQKPGVKFTTRGGIEELKKRVEREKKEKK